MNNVVVYAIARKYDIEELKGLATAKFRKLLFLEEPNDACPIIVGTVFETTSITDPRLRDVVLQYCTEYSTNIIADDRLFSILKDYSELGLNVLREVDRYANREPNQKRRLREQLVTLNEELAQMVKKASKVEKMRPINSSVTAVLQELKTTYKNLEISGDESAGSDEGDDESGVTSIKTAS